MTTKTFTCRCSARLEVDSSQKDFHPLRALKAHDWLSMLHREKMSSINLCPLCAVKFKAAVKELGEITGVDPQDICLEGFKR